ncbi:MAG: transporter substrate-binding domain-containing protein [Granulosicoccus sp.]
MQIPVSESLKQRAKEQLAPDGNLRVAVNLSNFLLVSCETDGGQPDGVSPAIARAIAENLSASPQIIAYDGPGQIADAASSDAWDLANIAAEPARAEVISFSPAYCEIQATYLLPPDCPVEGIAGVDKPGYRIAVKERSAYDLWLSANLQHATLVRAPSLDASFSVFRDQKLDALAGLRPKLLEQQELMPGSSLLDESFTSVQQSIGCQQGKPEASQYLSAFVVNAINSGLIAQLVSKYDVAGKLSVANVSLTS